MLHQTIKNDITTALRAKDTIRLDVLRGLNALIMNEMLASKDVGEFLPDDKVLALVKRSAKQRKDSIEQFEKGGRADLVDKEKAELVILNSFLPTLMPREEVKIIASQRIEALKSAGTFDPKAGGKIMGMLIKELAGRADGADVKAVVEELIKG
ncbi:MAG: GatB/YqeY domain-containing protein [Candidatus Pacebacteria bacterium]|nr:GatB/YqeY domain-containing protein [Candidatus Paceibacterota bacterium]